MGWLIVLAIKPLFENLPFIGLVWLVVGGLFYTFGSIFYVWRRVPYHHAIWHLFVLAGSICHFICVLLYVW
jgi:hemolysin III